MEILQFLLNFFLNELGIEDATSLFGLKDGNFDLKSFLNNLSPEKVAPIIETVFKNANEKSPPENFGGLAPIASIADRDIIYSLNGYFAEIT